MVTSGVGSGSARGTRRRTSSTSPDGVHGSAGVPQSQLLVMASAQPGVATLLDDARQRIDITGQSSSQANPFRSTPGGAFTSTSSFAITKRYAATEIVTVLTLMCRVSSLTSRDPPGLLMQQLVIRHPDV